MSEFPFSNELCRSDHPLDWSEKSRSLMIKACREMAIFHSRHNREFDWLCRKAAFNVESINVESDLEKIPAVGVTAMKYYLLLSLAEEAAVLKLTSSGTRGQKTQIWFDRDSLDRVQSMLELLWRQEGLISKKQTNYMMMVYDPEEAKDLGIAFTLKNQQRFAPPSETYFAIRKNAMGAWEFNMKAVIEKLNSYIGQGKPVRIMGIISFIYELLEELEKTGAVALPPESFLLTGGGWKTADEKKVPRDYFRGKASRILGIPDENIRDAYGMAEHSAPYIECKRHRFHIPVYNRIFIRNPETMTVMSPGEIGLLQLISPFNAMMPNLSILSTDMGHIDPDPCPCGWKAPTFTLVGRGGLVKHKGCALRAGEILRRKSS